MARTPQRPVFPSKRPKHHENGVLTFAGWWEAWAPSPTPDQARAAFADTITQRRGAGVPPEHRATVRLIIGGQVETEVELRDKRGRS